MKRLLPWTLTALALLTVGAAADLSVKDGGGVTRLIKNYVCETTKLCNATVLIKSDGTEVGTSSAPLRVDPTGTTPQPVTGDFATSVKQSDGSQKTQIVDGAGAEIGTSAAEVFVGGRGTAGSAAGGVLTVQGSASGTAIPVSLATVPSHAVTNAGTFATQAAVTAASGSYASGAFASGSMVDLGAIADAAVTAGATGSVSAKLRSISRDVMTTNTWAGGTLGAMANYGTTPGAVLVPGVNAFVTNTLAPGQAALASSSPVAIAKNSGTGSTVAGAAVGTAGTASTEVVTVQGIAAGTVIPTSPTPYPATAVPYTATATGTTGATTATLAGAASVTTYICGFSIRANATAAATGNATVTGVITATLNFTQWTAPNASGLGITEMIFAPCIPASAANTSIAVVSAAPGTGGVVSVTAWGYKL